MAFRRPVPLVDLTVTLQSGTVRRMALILHTLIGSSNKVTLELRLCEVCCQIHI